MLRTTDSSIINLLRHDMTELQVALKIALANAFAMYFKAHSFHWNVEGIHFSQYHDFFGGIYQDVYGSIDPMAEQIRKLGTYAPTSLNELVMSKTMPDVMIVGDDVKGMLLALQTANDEMISTLNKVFTLATTANEQGLCNFIADRIDVHKRHGWQTASSLKGL